MITLIQLPFSPFCISIRRMLDWAGQKYRLTDVSYAERRACIEATNGQYYQVPVLIDGKTVVWDKTELGQEVARYVSGKFELDCFPPNIDGLQRLIAQNIEADVEGPAFRIHDTYFLPTLPLYERTMAIRHKERKFGKGCVEQWHSHCEWWQKQLVETLAPYENMLATSKFLLAERPYFVDFDLYGVLGMYLFSGKTKLPSDLKNIRRWHAAMNKLGA